VPTACPYQKVHLVAHRHISPRNLNAARTVNSLCLSAATDVGVRVVAARIQEEATR
jgi:hypothetical protein